MPFQYLTDEKGRQTAVLVPIHEWERLNSEVSKLHNKELLFKDLQTSYQEIQDFQAGKTKLAPINDLFNDSRLTC